MSDRKHMPGADLGVSLCLDGETGTWRLFKDNLPQDFSTQQLAVVQRLVRYALSNASVDSWHVPEWRQATRDNDLWEADETL